MAAAVPAALLAAVVLASSPPPAVAVVVAVALLVTPGLVVTDLVSRRLPDRLVGPLAAATLGGLALHAATGAGSWPSALQGLAVGVAVLVAGGAVSWWGGLGMGDVKLGAALATSTALTGTAAELAGGAVLATGSVAAAGAVAVAARQARRARGPGDARLGSGAEGTSPARVVPLGPVLLAAWWATVTVEAIGASTA